MAFLSVSFILLVGMLTASMSVIGMYSFIKVHDWHYIVGCLLYAFSTFLIFRAIF